MQLSTAINTLLSHQSLTGEETYDAFSQIIGNKDTEMNQGAFLAAITSKGATGEEIAAIHQCIYDFDTNKINPRTNKPIADNSGTGMDKLKTFNISTAASVIAASAGVAMARHGSRAITSSCGTVDVAEALGINVDCDINRINNSIENCGMGLFNGMSPAIHPEGLGRILSQISFGSVLNIAASLANPAAPQYGIRGINDPEKGPEIIAVMKAMGYKRAMVIHGLMTDGSPGIDEATTLGTTLCWELKENGNINHYQINPEEFNISTGNIPEIITSGNAKTEAQRIIRILQSKASRCEEDIVVLNAALILYITGVAETINQGVIKSRELISSGDACKTLKQWQQYQ